MWFKFFTVIFSRTRCILFSIFCILIHRSAGSMTAVGPRSLVELLDFTAEHTILVGREGSVKFPSFSRTLISSVTIFFIFFFYLFASLKYPSFGALYEGNTHETKYITRCWKSLVGSSRPRDAFDTAFSPTRGTWHDDEIYRTSPLVPPCCVHVRV